MAEKIRMRRRQTLQVRSGFCSVAISGRLCTCVMPGAMLRFVSMIGSNTRGSSTRSSERACVNENRVTTGTVGPSFTRCADLEVAP
tara:strand:+ start:2884 stop:3141 length:258 start_codon:yes stop_codon:yes gene_type:complete